MEEKDYRIIATGIGGRDVDLIMFKHYRKFLDKNFKFLTQEIYNFSENTVYTTWRENDLFKKELPIIKIQGERPESMAWTIEEAFSQEWVKINLEEI